MNRREEFWVKCWRDAAEKSLYRETFPEERKCWDATADYYDAGMGSSNEPVSYTHLDVYKRQAQGMVRADQHNGNGRGIKKVA